MALCGVVAAATVVKLSGETVEDKFSQAANTEVSFAVFDGVPPGRAAPRRTAPPEAKLSSEPMRSAQEISTFAADVDTASFTIARNALRNGYLPSSGSIRVEEFLNYFQYDYAQPPVGRPALAQIEAAPSPIAPSTVLVSIGIQAGTPAELPPVHLTFLVDVSGSMAGALPLAQQSMRTVVEQLRPHDSVALVTYSGSTEVVLRSTSARDVRKIFRAIDGLNAAGGTAMGAGMRLAYDIATESAGADRVSHVMVMSDGDANIGARHPSTILADVRSAVADGVTLSTVGFGNGAYNDAMMEGLANAGNGNYIYVDTEAEVNNFARRLRSMLHVIAKDVKIQVEFNDIAVSSWRQVGYKNRQLTEQQFRDDQVDAGEIGVGHQVTALYEVKLRALTLDAQSLATVRFRYKQPTGGAASEVSAVVRLGEIKRDISQTSDNFRFQTAVALFAEGLMTRSLAKAQIVRLVEGSIGDYPERRQLLAMAGAVGRKLSVVEWESPCEGACF